MHDLALPLPYIKLDSAGRIIDCSALAEEMMDLDVLFFSGLVDEESRPKLETAMASGFGVHQIELTIKTKNHPLELFDLHINNTEDGHVLLLSSKQQSESAYMEKIQELQNRLSSTDFELYEKKVALEEILERLDKLSGPFISLTSSIGYIPLFGDITAHKIEVISGSCQAHVFKGNYTNILIDCTAVGQVDEEGFNKLLEMIRSLNLITGNKVVLIGINPQHAQKWSGFDFDELVHFNRSLQKVLKQHLHVV